MSEFNNQRGSFWPSYVDIMTTLFAIMLVLFAVSYSRFKVKEKELSVLADHFIEIIDIYDAVGNIDPTIFEADTINSKNILKLDIQYQAKGYDLLTQLDLDKDNETKEQANALRKKIRAAGQSIRSTILKLQANEKLKKDIKYLVVIEGQSSRVRFDGGAWENNYTLSYLRAWNLHKFWQSQGIDFTKMDRCELVICGSGEEGVPRIKPAKELEETRFNSKDAYKQWESEEIKNQRFLVHIVPVIGKLNMDTNIKDLVEKYRSENTENTEKKIK